MKTKCYTEITDNLYLGNQYSTSIVADVDVIVSIGCKSKSSHLGVVYHKISVADSAESDLTPYLNSFTADLHAHLAEGKKILVHCQGGINRSPMFVIAFLAKYHMSLDEAIALVISKRPSVRIQPHYTKQVQDWLLLDG